MFTPILVLSLLGVDPGFEVRPAFVVAVRALPTDLAVRGACGCAMPACKGGCTVPCCFDCICPTSSAVSPRGDTARAPVYGLHWYTGPAGRVQGWGWRSGDRVTPVSVPAVAPTVVDPLAAAPAAGPDWWGYGAGGVAGSACTGGNCGPAPGLFGRLFGR